MLDLSAWRNRAERLVEPLAQAVVAVMAAALGLFLGKTIVSPKWTIPITYLGIALQLVLILASPVLGFLAWIAFSPFGRFFFQVISLGRGVPDLTLDRLVIAVLVTLLVAQLATRQRRGVRIGAVEILGLLYVGGMLLSVNDSVLGRVSSLQSCFDAYVIPFIVYLVAKNLITNRRDLRAAMHVLLFVGLYMALLAAHEQLTGDIWFYPEGRTIVYTANVRRVVALLGNPAFLALVINLAVPFTTYLLVTARSGAAKLFYLICLFVLGLGTFLCYNRSAWLALPLSLLVMAFFSTRLRKYLLPALVVVGIGVAVGGTAILAVPGIAQRLFAAGPIAYRQKALGVAWTMLKDHPLTGVGFDNYRFYYTRYAYWDPLLIALPQPHNSYLSVALSAGIPVGICYLLMFGAFFLETGRLYLRAGERTFPDRTAIAALWGAMAAYLVPGLVMDTIQGTYPTVILSLIMGMTLGAWQNRVIPPLEELRN